MRNLILAGVILTLSSGCASTKVMKLDKAGDWSKSRVGVPVFVPEQWHQYLVVSTGPKGLEAKIATLPEYTDRPNYAVKHRVGLGSHKTGISLSAGILTSLNMESDSKVAETATAVGGIVGSGATLATSLTALLGGSQDLEKVAPDELPAGLTKEEIEKIIAAAVASSNYVAVYQLVYDSDHNVSLVKVEEK